MESILIVDDDINLSSLLEEELREVGYTAEKVHSAGEALDFLDGKSVDLMLLDLKLPDKDGFFVLRSLREKGIEVKVIVLTGYADIKSAIDSSKLGASDFITKPYDFDELLISIRKVLYM